MSKDPTVARNQFRSGSFQCFWFFLYRLPVALVPDAFVACCKLGDGSRGDTFWIILIDPNRTGFWRLGVGPGRPGSCALLFNACWQYLSLAGPRAMTVAQTYQIEHMFHPLFPSQCLQAPQVRESAESTSTRRQWNHCAWKVAFDGLGRP